VDGFLRLVKPPGMTSHDVVAYVRRVLGTRAVGHTGTLDPAAAGLLVLTVGTATRLGEYLLDGDKAYRAEATLGLRTSTADAEGEVISRTSAAGVSEVQVAEALRALEGPLVMRPPAHSAVRVGGRRLYEMARAGTQVEAPERHVHIHETRLLEFAPGDLATVLFDVTCSKGTYVRSLAEMLGERLGVGGTLSALIRTRVGPHELSDAVTLEELAEQPQACLLPPEQALPHLAQLVLDVGRQAGFLHGNPVPVAEGAPCDEPLLVLSHDGRLLGIGRIERRQPGVLQPQKVLAPADR
jgi:tRNA pseudouridine55 synthase